MTKKTKSKTQRWIELNGEITKLADYYSITGDRPAELLVEIIQHAWHDRTTANAALEAAQRLAKTYDDLAFHQRATAHSTARPTLPAVPATLVGDPLPFTEQVYGEIVDKLRAGQLVAAVALCRQASNLSLREAYEFVKRIRDVENLNIAT